MAMRVDPFEDAKLRARQDYAWRVFDWALSRYPATERRTYWVETEVPYLPIFAYEELLAPFKDDPNDPKKVLASMVRLTARVTDGAVDTFRVSASPDEQQRILQEFSRTGEEIEEAARTSSVAAETMAEETVRLAESSWDHLLPHEREAARSALTRLVWVGRPEDGARRDGYG